MSILTLFHRPAEKAAEPERPRQSPSPFVMPFMKDKVTQVEFEVNATASCLNHDQRVKATVRMKSETSNGWHYIYADTLEEAVGMVRDFVEKLP